MSDKRVREGRLVLRMKDGEYKVYENPTQDVLDQLKAAGIDVEIRPYVDDDVDTVQ